MRTALVTYRDSLPRLSARLATPLIALAIILATPRRAVAGPLYEECLNGVDSWRTACREGTRWFWQNYTCDWLAGVGYMACVVVGAMELWVENAM